MSEITAIASARPHCRHQHGLSSVSWRTRVVVMISCCGANSAGPSWHDGANGKLACEFESTPPKGATNGWLAPRSRVDAGRGTGEVRRDSARAREEPHLPSEIVRTDAARTLTPTVSNWTAQTCERQRAQQDGVRRTPPPARLNPAPKLAGRSSHAAQPALLCARQSIDS